MCRAEMSRDEPRRAEMSREEPRYRRETRRDHQPTSAVARPAGRAVAAARAPHGTHVRRRRADRRRRGDGRGAARAVVLGGGRDALLPLARRPRPARAARPAPAAKRVRTAVGRDRQLPPLVNGQLLQIHQLMTRRDRQLPPARRRASGAPPTHTRRRGRLPPPVRLAPRALPPPRAAAGQLPVAVALNRKGIGQEGEMHAT